MELGQSDSSGGSSWVGVDMVELWRRNRRMIIGGDGSVVSAICVEIVACERLAQVMLLWVLELWYLGLFGRWPPIDHAQEARLGGRKLGQIVLGMRSTYVFLNRAKPFFLFDVEEWLVVGSGA
jgi:hypothetical protein